jgi:glycosyltransferase involved in cell wall biosynthesis
VTDVTVVIPTRERPDYLRATLHSILASAAEAAVHSVTTRILVVDDASPTDSTSRLATELGVDYHRIPVHDGRNNPASAIAKGVSLVESRFYSVFGDDDIMLPRFIGAHVSALDAGYDVCTTAFVRTDADLRPVREVTLPEAELGDLLAGRITVNDGAMTRTELVHDLSWDPDLEQVIFYPIWLELLFRGARFTRLLEPLFLYRRHGDNVSDQLDERDAELRTRVREHYRDLVLARDGVLPEPTRPVAASPIAGTKPVARRPRWQRLAGRLRSSVRGRKPTD